MRNESTSGLLSLFTLFAVLSISVLSCSLLGADDTPKELPQNIYKEFGQKAWVGDDLFAENTSGQGYFYQLMEVKADNILSIQVKSDIPSQNGEAKARYEIEDDRLTLNIISTDTDYYKKGSTVRFEQHRLVDNSYSTIFYRDSTTTTFRGPGLILWQEKPDADDLDDDNDTKEVVTSKIFFQEGYSY